MDENRPNITRTNHDLVESNLPDVLASLEMLTVTTNFAKSPENKRLLRKRIPKVLSSEILNRRCSIRPKKRNLNIKTDKNVKDYYLDKTLKTGSHTLETIFEEKNETNEDSVHMSIKRYKRMIQFEPQPTSSKIKKRRQKIKKVFGTNRSFKAKKSSMQALLDKLNRIRLETSIKKDIEVK